MIWILLAAAILLVVAHATLSHKHEAPSPPLWMIQPLNRLRKEGQKLLVKPNGQIVGVVERDSIPFYDERHKVKRSKIVYYDLDGKKREEPRDAVSKKTGQVVDLVTDVEKDGGVMLTQLSNPDGTIVHFVTGPEAERIVAENEDLKAMEGERRRMEDEYKTKDRNYRRLQREISRVKQEREQLEEDLKDFSESNERLNSLNAKLNARIRGEEARANMLEGELKALMERHKNLTEEVNKILASARTRRKEEIKLGLGEKLAEETKPPAEAKPKEAK